MGSPEKAEKQKVLKHYENKTVETFVDNARLREIEQKTNSTSKQETETAGSNNDDDHHSNKGSSELPDGMERSSADIHANESLPTGDSKTASISSDEEKQLMNPLLMRFLKLYPLKTTFLCLV
ncbi:MAG: hypothetical protein HWD61_01480 [Parachlamydiaceae bacterium]|nr:MAG: hypothetical protein HWD61_01480 [Parachlamydiaceae bacterium]